MKNLILALFLTFSFPVFSQNVLTETVKKRIENTSITKLSSGNKEVIIKDSNGINLRTKKIKNKTYTYEIRRNGRLLEAGTVEVNGNRRTIKTKTKDGKIFQNRL